MGKPRGGGYSLFWGKYQLRNSSPTLWQWTAPGFSKFIAPSFHRRSRTAPLNKQFLINFFVLSHLKLLMYTFESFFFFNNQNKYNYYLIQTMTTPLLEDIMTGQPPFFSHLSSRKPQLLRGRTSVGTLFQTEYTLPPPPPPPPTHTPRGEVTRIGHTEFPGVLSAT